MPKDPALGGLSNFGLSADTQSSNLGDVSTGLADILGNRLLDEVSKARLYRERMQQVAQQQPEGMLARILSPGGLAALGTAAAAGIFGGEEGAAAGAGVVLGAINKARVLQELERSQQSKAMDELQKKEDASLERIDKMQQRVATAVNTQPEMFTNPETGEPSVPPMVLGQLAYGADIPIYPNARRAMNQRDENWKEFVGVLEDRYKNAATPEDRNTIGRYLLNMLHGEAVPESVMESLSHISSEDLNDQNRQILSTLLPYGPTSVLSGAIEAGKRGVSMMDPEILSMMDLNETKTRSPVTAQDRLAGYIVEINNYQNDPANVETLRNIRQETGSDPIAFNRRLAQEVFKNRAADMQDYLKQEGLMDDGTRAMLQEGFRSYMNALGIAKVVTGVNAAKTMGPGATMEDVVQTALDGAWTFVNSMKETTRRNDAASIVDQTTKLSKTLTTELQLGTLTANEIARRVDRAARNSATRPDGSVDQLKYEAEAQRLLAEAMKEIRKERGSE